ncbi:hypothetical protein CH54_3274 [Yersinia rochesterensis]|uniref:Uncharacterized protein n=1 Tax=Yersinia rochesterensis TaxID=1604335 RepID=A0ABN4FCP0_9GAMM|nr:hypothetical protein [Yersinia rochesterensis]AIN17175.1 hypothetical protein DJ57_38 [Yersinia rochesterensis]AJI87928.1 hypothetical protein AW19_2513 [Yersinia frederiksenii Y225]AJJ35126.1 hypothetical protein CH54_3274 [Yersinia rochesterensis]CRY65351.1 Uncharacterised protein [Yersinia kristensenii]
MKYFSLMIFLFSITNSYALEFTIAPGVDDADGNQYYSLTVKGDNESKSIDIVLEGNATTAAIKDTLSISCPWGIAEGVRVSMSSSSIDGVMIVDEIYFFNKQLDNVFAKGFTRFENTTWKKPPSLNHFVCENSGVVIKKDIRLGRDYLESNEVVSQGPFLLKGISNVYIKYILNGDLKFIREDEVGETIVETYKNKKNYAPNVITVFFMEEPLKRKVVSLISWGESNSNVSSMCYKVYAYSYNNAGILSPDLKINDDQNLSMCESKDKKFKYKNASDIRKYLAGK